MVARFFSFKKICFFLIISISCFLANDLRAYSLSSAKIIVHTLAHIDRSYLDPSRIDNQELFKGALEQVQLAIPEILAQCEEKNFCTITVGNGVKRFTHPKPRMGGLLMKLREVLLFIETHLGQQDEKQLKEIEYAIINGMLGKLDPHSSLLPPEVYNEFQVGTKGEFGGLGIVIGLRDGKLTIISPVKGTPAYKARLKPKDKIIQIDEESTINMGLTEAVSKLRGPVGSKIRLKIEREGENAPIVAILTRAIISIEAVQSALIETKQNKKIGVIHIKNFQSNTNREFAEQIKTLSQKAQSPLDGIILDLRNNPGGLLEQAVFLADTFLKEGTIVTTVGPNNRVYDKKLAGLQGYEIETPLVVLLNEGSASASEIVAGALKNNDRAIVIGVPSFGKGTVQTIYELPHETALKMTIAEYLTPGNHSIQSIGITPDIQLLPVTLKKERIDYIPNEYTSEEDLDAHVESKLTSKDSAFFSMRYLEAQKGEEEDSYSDELDVKSDLVIDMAVLLLEETKYSERKEFLKNSLLALRQMEAKEEAKIIARFKELDIDWSKSFQKKPSHGKVDLQIFKEKPLEKLNAGDEVKIKLTFTNTGKSPFERLIARTSSSVSSLQDLEFPFGKVLPGESKSWERPFKVPDAILSQKADIAINFEDANNLAPPSTNLNILIQEKKRARFAFSYELKGAKKKILPNKKISLKVNLWNKGEGEAEKPIVSIKNLSGKGVFLEKGLERLDNLKQNEKKTATLTFHTTEDLKEDSFDLELGIVDAAYTVGLSKKITINKISLGLIPEEKKFYEGPEVIISQNYKTTNHSPIELKGLSVDDHQLKDIYIFSNNQKVYYRSNPTQTSKSPFLALVPLKQGNNTISIFARDDLDLTTRTFFVINYEALQPEKTSSSLVTVK